MALAIAAVLILILDQGVKYWVNSSLAWHEGTAFIPGFISLYKVPNTGGAFGLLKDASWFPLFIVILSILISGVIIFCIARKIIRGSFGRIAAIFVMSGALGNCIDRLITGVSNGYVTDMFKFEFAFLSSFPIFNVADIFLVIGGLLFATYFITDNTEEPVKRVRKPVEAGAGKTLAAVPLPSSQNAPDDRPSRQPARPANSPASRPTANGAANRRTANAPAPRPANAEPKQPARPASAEPNQPEPKRRQNISIEKPEYNLDDILAELSDDDI